MLEIPETYTIARQLRETVVGKTIRRVEQGKSPHGFAFFTEPKEIYESVLQGARIDDAYPLARIIEIAMGSMRLALSDGVNIRFFAAGSKIPDKHQLLIEFEDGSALVFTVQMYGELSLFQEGGNQDNFYYQVAKQRPSPLTDAFDLPYFLSLKDALQKPVSAKAFLATEQRIPGLGNGALQDILLVAGIHPKTKTDTLRDADFEALFVTIKKLLKQMTDAGGRDTERDLFGNLGGYKTLLSKNTLQGPCPKCGGGLERQAYLGGNIYFCKNCQK